MKNCKCRLDQDGECDACKKLALTAGVRLKTIVGEFMQKFKEVEAEFARRIEEAKEEMVASGEAFGPVGACERCGDKYVDFACSKMVESLGKEDAQFGTAFIKNLQKKFKDRGVTKFPLTTKAWKDISR